MVVLIKVIIMLCTLLALHSCKTSKSHFYAYKIETYVTDTAKHFFYSDDLISYGNYLFEFKKKLKINNSIFQNGSNSTSIAYDTIGVFLLAEVDKQYYEFDTFALSGKLISKGDLSEKPFGQKINNATHSPDEGVSYSRPTKTKRNGIDCFIAEVVSTHKNITDTINQKVILIRGSSFNSLYKINGIKFSEKDYCIIGFEIFDIKNKEGFLQEITSMRKLSHNEIAICEKMTNEVERIRSSVRRNLE